LALLSLAAVYFLAWPIWRAQFLIEIWPTESWNAYWQAAAGAPLYPDPASLIGNNSLVVLCHRVAWQANGHRQPVGSMAKLKTVGLSYGALRKECLEAVRQWPGCETVGGIQIIRDNKPGGFSVRVTLYGKADEKIADRAIICVQREKRRHFHLIE
jgi:hypothetical protein